MRTGDKVISRSSDRFYHPTSRSGFSLMMRRSNEGAPKLQAFCVTRDSKSRKRGPRGAKNSPFHAVKQRIFASPEIKRSSTDQSKPPEKIKLILRKRKNESHDTFGANTYPAMNRRGTGPQSSRGVCQKRHFQSIRYQLKMF